MRSSPRIISHRRKGFTLIELLTVIAIIAVLATLLSSALASAKRKARMGASISNLRQIVLGTTLYIDDHERRPPSFLPLLDKKYLSGRVLICPEDKTKNWAGALAPGSFFDSLPPSRAEGAATPPRDARSYFDSFSADDFLWEQVQRTPSGGIAACQLHGMGRPNEAFPSVRDYQGLLLRGVKDGAVIQRQFFWDGTVVSSGPVNAPALGEAASSLPFFLDPAESQP